MDPTFHLSFDRCALPRCALQRRRADAQPLSSPPAGDPDPPTSPTSSTSSRPRGSLRGFEDVNHTRLATARWIPGPPGVDEPARVGSRRTSGVKAPSSVWRLRGGRRRSGFGGMEQQRFWPQAFWRSRPPGPWVCSTRGHSVHLCVHFPVVSCKKNICFHALGFHHGFRHPSSSGLEGWPWVGSGFVAVFDERSGWGPSGDWP